MQGGLTVSAGGVLQQPSVQRLALVAGIWLFVIVVFSRSYGSMWDLWQTSDHRHGVLVFPISMFLIWRTRHELADIPLKLQLSGAPLLVLLAACWGLATLAGVQVLEHFFALALIPAAVYTFAGYRLTRVLAFPLFFLMLGTPISDSLIPVLMRITADISSGLLQISGIPTLRSGQYISLPGGEFVVAEVCSGARYLIAGLTVILVYGHLAYSTIGKKLILASITIVVLVFANGLRAYIVMAIASYSDMRVFGGRDHIYFGWILFGVTMVAIMWFGSRYAERDAFFSAQPAPAEGGARPVPRSLPIAALGLIMLAVTVKPLVSGFGLIGPAVVVAAALLAFSLIVSRAAGDATPASDRPAGSHAPVGLRDLLVGMSALAILAFTPEIVETAERGAVQTVHTTDLSALVPCTPAGPWSSAWQPRFRNPDSEVAAGFDCDGRTVNVYVAAYATATQGTELISTLHQPVPRAWDRYRSVSRHSVRDARGFVHDVIEVKFDSPVLRTVVWYWYEVDGRVVTRGLTAKLWQIVALLRQKPSGGRVVLLEFPGGQSPMSPGNRLEAVAVALISETVEPRLGGQK